MTQNEIIPTIGDGWWGSFFPSSLAPALKHMSHLCTIMNGVCHKPPLAIKPFTQENHTLVTRDANRWEEHEMSAHDTQKLMLIQLQMQITAYLDP